MSVFVEPKRQDAMELFANAFVPQAIQPVNQLSQMLTQQAQNQPSANALGQMLGLKGDQLNAFSQLNPEQQKMLLAYKGAGNKANAKQQEKTLEVAEAGTEIGNVISKMNDLISYTGATWIPGTDSWGAGGPGLLSVNRKALEKRNQFDALVPVLTNVYKKLEAGNVLSKRIFEDLMTRVPDSKLSERENIGRLKASLSITNSKLRAKGLNPIEIKGLFEGETKNRKPLEGFLQ